MHRTFQEYLAAKEAAEDQAVDALVTRAHLDQWWETIVMAVGHATPERRAALLSGVLDQADTEPKHCRRLRLLAAACLDTAQMVDPEVTNRIEAAVDELVPPRGQNETRSLALASGRMLRRLPSTLDGLSDASAAASVKTAALVGGPEALRLLARWSPDPRSSVQRALAQVWRYFDPADYAQAVLQDAPLDRGTISVTLVEHIPHLHILQHLRDASIELISTGKVDNLDFLHIVPPVITRLEVEASGQVGLNRSGYDRDRVAYNSTMLAGSFFIWKAASYSTGGMFWQEPWMRRWLYQSTHSNVASSTSSRVRHGPLRLMSSVL